MAGFSTLSAQLVKSLKLVSYNVCYTFWFYEETLQYCSELQEVNQPTADIICNQTIWENRYINILQSRIDPLLGEFGKKMVSLQYISYASMESFFGPQRNKRICDINWIFLNALQIRQSFPLNWRQLIENKTVKTKINIPFVNLSDKASWLRQLIHYTTNSSKTDT